MNETKYSPLMKSFARRLVSDTDKMNSVCDIGHSVNQQQEELNVIPLSDICNNCPRSDNSNQEYNTRGIYRADLFEGRYCVAVSRFDSS
mmetsp:Transcript_21363/g.21697  ORF Transcript_21363/g.21697 Transcript_21363/m.21697 type:complete len:89 (+) Transcript_21363:534-800(+)